MYRDDKASPKGHFCFKPHTHNRKLSATCWFTRFVHFCLCISILFNTIHFINGFSSSVFKCSRRPMKYLTKCLIALTYYAKGRLPFWILIFPSSLSFSILKGVQGCFTPARYFRVLKCGTKQKVKRYVCHIFWAYRFLRSYYNDLLLYYSISYVKS